MIATSQSVVQSFSIGWSRAVSDCLKRISSSLIERVGSDQVADVSDELGYSLMVEVFLGQLRGLSQSKSQNSLHLSLLLIHSAHYVAVWGK